MDIRMGGWMTACRKASTNQSWMNIIKHKIQSSSGQAQQIEDGQQQLLPNHMGTIDRPSSSLVDTGSGFDIVARPRPEK